MRHRGTKLTDRETEDEEREQRKQRKRKSRGTDTPLSEKQKCKKTRKM